MLFDSIMRGFKKSTSRGSAKGKRKGAAAAEPYHAVAIQVGKQACASSKSATGKRFLAVKAPLLPLPGCDSAMCKCRYVHFPDRRDDARRAVDVGMSSSSRSAGERRGGRRDRRSRDPKP